MDSIKENKTSWMKVQEKALLMMMNDGDGEWVTHRLLGGRRKTIWKVKPYTPED